MCAIAQNGSDQTSYYWNLATPTNDCPNWIARWFLYHKFRYRDGRNRNAGKAEVGSSRHHHSHHPHSSHRRQSYVAATEQSSYSTGSYYYSGTSASSGMCQTLSIIVVNVGRNNDTLDLYTWLLPRRDQLLDDTRHQPNEPRWSAIAD
jgi:hypothetical protein